MNGREDIAMGTQIGATMADNSSEERIIVPEGKIFTHTEIETTVESNNEYRSSMEQAHRPKGGL